MKKLLFIATLLLMVSCSDDKIETNEPKATTNETAKLCTTVQSLSSDPTGRVSYKQFYWKTGQTIKIKFLNGDTFVQNKVKFFANQWLNYANLKFEWVAPNENADIKIAFKWNGDAGSWSYMGIVNPNIAQNQPSMNFGWFDSKTADDEFSRTVLHEFGHALNLAHEHQNPAFQVQWNADAVYTAYAKLGWDKQKIDDQILNKFPVEKVDYTDFDSKSIMLYYFSKDLTLNNYEFPMNRTLSAEDKKSIATIYPGVTRSKLYVGETLIGGESLLSNNKRYQFAMQADGNLVVYDLISGGKRVEWTTNTYGSAYQGSTITMQPDGNLVLYKNGKALWSSRTDMNPGADLIMQDDGNLVIYLNGKALWSSRYGLILKNKLSVGETLYIGKSLFSNNKRYELQMQSDGNLVLYDLISGGRKPIWATNTYGTAYQGAIATMQSDGNLVLKRNGIMIWSSKTDKNPGADLTLQDDGNLFIYLNGKALWSSKLGRTY
nr:hypothetical protein [uncultured Flavobacterium sp.]